MAETGGDAAVGLVDCGGKGIDDEGVKSAFRKAAGDIGKAEEAGAAENDGVGPSPSIALAASVSRAVKTRSLLPASSPGGMPIERQLAIEAAVP